MTLYSTRGTTLVDSTVLKIFYSRCSVRPLAIDFTFRVPDIFFSRRSEKKSKFRKKVNFESIFVKKSKQINPCGDSDGLGG